MLRHFSDLSQFGNLGPKNHLKYFRSILRHQTTLFYGPNLTMEMELIYCINHHGASGCHVNPHYLNVWDIHVVDFLKTFYKVQT
jgi:hypothetical protein